MAVFDKELLDNIAGAGNFSTKVTKSGIYNFKIVSVLKFVNNSGAESWITKFQTKYGKEAIVLGPRLYNNDGSVAFEQEKALKMAIVADIDPNQLKAENLTKDDVEFKNFLVEKLNQKYEKIEQAYTQFNGKEIYVALSREWSKYQDKLKSNLRIYDVFNEQKQSANEIVSGKDFNTFEKCKPQDTYQNVTKEEVESFFDKQSEDINTHELDDNGMPF